MCWFCTESQSKPNLCDWVSRKRLFFYKCSRQQKLCIRNIQKLLTSGISLTPLKIWTIIGAAEVLVLWSSNRWSPLSLLILLVLNPAAPAIHNYDIITLRNWHFIFSLPQPGQSRFSLRHWSLLEFLSCSFLWFCVHVSLPMPIFPGTSLTILP